MTGYTKTTIADALGLTGAEISINTMEGGTAVPFVHTHKDNEEIYLVLSGSGRIELDGENVDLAAGDALRVAPPVRRQVFAGEEGLRYACIQVRAGSLGGFTGDDGVIG